MCRFLMVKAGSPVRPAPFFEEFAVLAERSPAPDGAGQGDGWGAAWIGDEGRWRDYKSLRPIWEDGMSFSRFPASAVFCAHARSASFPDHKDRLEFNQPFVGRGCAFVFNGLLQGVRLPRPVSGEIGAQKIWSLLAGRLAERPAGEALDDVLDFLRSRTRRIQALNVGLSDGRRLYVYSTFDADEAYYTLWSFDSPELTIICSGPLPGRDFSPVPKNSLLIK